LKPTTLHAVEDQAQLVPSNVVDESFRATPSPVAYPPCFHSSTSGREGGVRLLLEKDVVPVSLDGVARDESLKPAGLNPAGLNPAGLNPAGEEWKGNAQDEAAIQVGASEEDQVMQRKLFVRGFPVGSSVAEEVKEVQSIFKDVVELTHVDVFEGR
jgi:hypothetical protein